MPLLMNLGRMIDLALGTPDVGAVNFNILSSLLHAMVKSLGISNVEAEVLDNDQAEETAEGEPNITVLDQYRNDDQRQRTVEQVTMLQTSKDTSSNICTDEQQNSDTFSTSQLWKLEKKVEELEKQWYELKCFPSNSEILGHLRNENENLDKKARPMSDMWLSIQLSKKVEANTEGVTKCLSLMEDLFSEFEMLKNTFDKSSQQLGEQLNLPENMHTSLLQSGNLVTNNFDEIWAKIQSLESDLQQARPVSLNALHGQELSGESGDLLENSQDLFKEYDALKAQINQLQMSLMNKAEQVELDVLEDQLNKKMGDVMEGMDMLKQSHNQNNELIKHLQISVNELQLTVNQLQEMVAHLTDATQRLSDESIIHQNHIETLFCSCKELNEQKADKEFVETEVSFKANKEHLDEKVNYRNFDMTRDEINSSINNLVNKILGQEDDWKKVMTQVNTDLDAKLDRLEFGPFRDELEKQLRAFAKKITAAGADGGKDEITDEDAAGFRKQLLKNFHCISCDRLLDVKPPKRTVTCLPVVPALPESRSLRPHTVFELDQIRRLANSHVTQQSSQVPEIIDPCSRPRFCGGSHTVTFPHRRITKISVSSNLNPAGPALVATGPSAPEFQQHGSSRKNASSKLPQIHATVNKSSDVKSVQQHISGASKSAPLLQPLISDNQLFASVDQPLPMQTSRMQKSLNHRTITLESELIPQEHETEQLAMSPASGSEKQDAEEFGRNLLPLLVHPKENTSIGGSTTSDVQYQDLQ